jgi:tetratricopeptide (TPR) repeat protein
MTKRYTGDVDPQQIGRTLSVSNVITGDYRNEGGRIGLSVESIDVANNAVVWRDSIEVAGEDLIAMRNDLSSRIRNGLFPRLNISDVRAENGPRNDEAYRLFMRAAAMSNDPQPNREALAMLHRAVELDAGYAPAWAALSRREYDDNEYGNGGDAARVRAIDAARKALQLDPDLTLAAKQVIVMDVEGGQTEDAYRQASALLRRRPESAEAHFAIAYVLRYAGLLDDAAKECEAARAIDPKNSAWRSCALTFLQLGDVARARQFQSLDGGSAWANNVEVSILLHEGKRTEAVRQAVALKQMLPRWRGFDFMEAIEEHKPAEEIERTVVDAKRDALEVADAEPAYFAAADLASFGRYNDALELLRTTAPRNYCAVMALDRDPVFGAVRSTTEFRQIRQAAAHCQQKFLAWRAQNAP